METERRRRNDVIRYLMTQQIRIVVRGGILPQAQKLLERTQLANLSDLFAILVTRYGTHLANTWVVDGLGMAPISEPRIKEAMAPIPEPRIEEEMAHEPEIDPEIVRLSRYIDNF
jgi:hypothetical protein